MASQAKPQKTPKAKSGGSALGVRIFLIVGPLVLVTVVAAGVAVFLGRGETRDALVQDLRRVNPALAVVQESRLRQLELEARGLTAGGTLTDLLAEQLAPRRRARPQDDDSEPPLQTRIDADRAELGLDLVLVLDPQARLIAQSGELEPAGDLAADPLLAAVRDDPAAAGAATAARLWYHDGRLYHAMATPLVRDFELVGFLALARSIEAMAGELKRSTRAEVVLWAQSPAGPAVLAASDRVRGDDVVDALRREGQGIARVARGETVEGVDLEVGGTAWLAFLVPLRGAGEGPLGVAAALVPVASRLAFFDRLILLLAAIGAAALGVGFLASFILGRATLAPLGGVATAAREISTGNYDVAIPKARGSFASLAAPLAELARSLRDRRQLETYLADASRGLPEPAGRSAAAEPAARQLALAVVEMRRFAHPKLAFDPTENAGRFAHDLRRVVGVVSQHRGAVEAVAGHRLLLTFDGEGNAMRALTAATQILLMLSSREDAFDEPVPPVIALTKGAVVTGGLQWGEETGHVVAGLPIQQLESLSREATPGELFCAKEILAELVEPLKQAGIKVRSQRGVVSPQPLYVLDAENAQRFTGAAAPSAAVEGAQRRLTLADAAVGETLGGRFEILATLLSDELGQTFKARDRERSDLVRLVLIRPEVMADARRFEALKTALSPTRFLEHPAALPLLDFAEVGGLPFVTLPFVRGITVRDLILESRQVPVPVAYLLGRQMAEGLAAAHRAKALHGALKPESVVVEPSGSVRMMDFGVVTPLDPATRDLPSPAAPYLAPEQLAGHTAQPRSDLFAWGAIVYEMVTGRATVAGRTPGEVASRRQAEAIAPASQLCADLPGALEEILGRCLATSPDERYPSAEDLVRALDALRA